MTEKTSATILREDYQAYPFEISKVALKFNLEPDTTRVSSTLHVKSKSVSAQDMYLHGEELELIDVSINDVPLQANDYHLDEDGLTIFNCSGDFTLSIT